MKYDYKNQLIALGRNGYQNLNFDDYVNNGVFDIQNKDYVKPKNGLWMSTYTPDKETPSDWVAWCASEQADWVGSKYKMIEIKPEARVFIVDVYDDLVELIEKWGPAGRQKGLGLPINRHYPDFQKIRQDIDIINLTEQGQYSTRMSYEGIKNYDLYGWDCESSLMLNNVIKAHTSMVIPIDFELSDPWGED